jgi:hypothetical protein
MSDNQPSAPRQYSPDGNWYWDGAAWQPAHATATGYPPAPAAKSRKPLIIGGSIAALLVLLVGIGIGSGGGSDVVASTPSTAAPSAPAVVEPSEQPGLPDTSGPDVVESMEAVTGHIDTYTGLMSLVGEELSTGDPDPDLVRAYLGDMKAETAAIEALIPDMPTCVADALEVFVSSQKKINRSVVLAIDSFEALDLDGLTRATDMLSDGTDGIVEANVLLQSCA